MDEIFLELSGPGYEHPYSDMFVPEDKAYEYAMEKIESDKDLEQDFIEWFFRDWNWTGEED